MLTKILSAAHFGLKTIPVEVEVNVSKKGFPGFNIIGLPSKAVEEAKERVRTAILNSGYDFPPSKIIVNLAPADLPKEGSCYDLPIAVGIIASLGYIKMPEEKSFFYGELSLDGTLRHTKGVFLLAISAKELSIENLFIPESCVNEACIMKNLNVFPVVSLRNLIAHLNGLEAISKKRNILIKSESLENENFVEFDFSEILGQEQAKRALEIAATGGHNILLQGPPGSGKTMLARALPGILPLLNDEESLEATKIYSITGNIPPGGSLITIRPFRPCHHTISKIGLIGGGSQPHPGEISLSHCGVLFLDELPEFPRSTLEALRQPLEDGYVGISREAGSVKFPSRFMLVAASNPCPCGFLGDPTKECRCSPRQIMSYQNKLSGPLLDRIDLHISVPAVKVDKLMSIAPAGKEDKVQKPETSRKIRRRVIKARELQNRRLAGTGIHVNANMKNKHIKKYCPLTNGAYLLLKQAVSNYSLSARAYFRIIKVARTIADLAQEKNISESHIAEALQYRIRVQE